MRLVTGGAGYIGSHFVKTYLERFPDEALVVVDNLSEGYAEAVAYSDRIHLVREDIGDTDAMERVLRDYAVDAVIHFAANINVGESHHHPAKYFQNNVVQSLNLFRAMEQAGVRKIVFSSTCATYGMPEYLPLDERHPQKPINVYGVTKLMVENALRGYEMSKGWSYVAFRYFNAAGADESGLIGERHEPETHLIPLVLKAALGQRPAIQVFGEDYDTRDGTCIRDYIHVNDLAIAHCDALGYMAQYPGGDAFNLGTTTGNTVWEVIRACEEVLGKKVPVEVVERRPGDPAVLVANADKANQLLGWTARYNLHEIIASAWKWEQSPGYSKEKLSVS
jgi:UDP-glucose 4-epimerase